MKTLLITKHKIVQCKIELTQFEFLFSVQPFPELQPSTQALLVFIEISNLAPLRAGLQFLRVDLAPLRLASICYLQWYFLALISIQAMDRVGTRLEKLFEIMFIKLRVFQLRLLSIIAFFTRTCTHVKL